MCVAYRMWFTDGSGVAPHTKTSHLTLSNCEMTLKMRYISPLEDYSRSSIDNIQIRLLSCHYRPVWNASITVKWLISPINVTVSGLTKAGCLVSGHFCWRPFTSLRPPPPVVFILLLNWNQWPTCQCQVTRMPSLCVYGGPEQHLAPGPCCSPHWPPRLGETRVGFGRRV